MIYATIMTKEEQETIARIENDIRLEQHNLLCDEIINDDDNFNFDEVREALKQGLYYNDICYIIKGKNILKETLQIVRNFGPEDFCYFNEFINTLQTIVDKCLLTA